MGEAAIDPFTVKTGVRRRATTAVKSAATAVSDAVKNVPAVSALGSHYLLQEAQRDSFTFHGFLAEGVGLMFIFSVLVIGGGTLPRLPTLVEEGLGYNTRAENYFDNSTLALLAFALAVGGAVTAVRGGLKAFGGGAITPLTFAQIVYDQMPEKPQFKVSGYVRAFVAFMSHIAICVLTGFAGAGLAFSIIGRGTNFPTGYGILLPDLTSMGPVGWILLSVMVEVFVAICIQVTFSVSHHHEAREFDPVLKTFINRRLRKVHAVPAVMIGLVVAALIVGATFIAPPFIFPYGQLGGVSVQWFGSFVTTNPTSWSTSCFSNATVAADCGYNVTYGPIAQGLPAPTPYPPVMFNPYQTAEHLACRKSLMEWQACQARTSWEYLARPVGLTVRCIEGTCNAFIQDYIRGTLWFRWAGAVIGLFIGYFIYNLYRWAFVSLMAPGA